MWMAGRVGRTRIRGGDMNWPLVLAIDDWYPYMKVVYSNAAGTTSTLWGNGVANGDPKNNVEQARW